MDHPDSGPPGEQTPAESPQEATEAPEAPTPTEPESAAPEASEAATDTVTPEVEGEITEETPETPETEAEEGKEAAPAEDSTEYIDVENFNDLAEHMGVDVADLYKIKVPISDAEGKKREITVGEWKDSFLQNEEIAHSRAEATRLETSAQELNDKYTQQLQDNAVVTAKFLQDAAALVMQDMQRIDWDTLERQNPGEWSRQRTRYSDLAKQIQGIQQQAAGYLTEQKSLFETRRGESLKQKSEREHELMLKAVPAWRDENVADAERHPIADNLMTSYGYTSEEAYGMDDHRAVLVARDAWKYRQMLADGSAAEKKVARLPKHVLKPGARKTKAEQGHETEQRLLAAHKKQGTVDSAAAAIAYRIGRKR